jgi:hypothetical protein
MFVGFNNHFEHITRVGASLLHQSVPDNQECGESCLGDTVQLFPFIVCLLESIHTAEQEQALDPSKDRLNIIGTKQLKSYIHICWPFLWKVIMKNLTDQGDELLSHLG